MNKILLGLAFVLFSCDSPNVNWENKVDIRIKKFPSSINYFNSTSSEAVIVQKNIFNSLLWFNKTGDAKPLLVKYLPKISRDGSTLVLDFEVREQAFWTNGEKIEPDDIEFSLKAFKLPSSLNIYTRTYLEPLKKVSPNKNNSQKFSIRANGFEKDAILLASDFDIIQKSRFDSLGLLDSITFEDIENRPEFVASDKNVKQFIDEFLKDNFKFKGKYLDGSGPYKIVGIVEGKYIRLQKKENWWGKGFIGKLPQFHANPDEIIYKCIPEPLVAIQALKSGNLDVMDDIPSSEFLQLKKNPSFLREFNLFAPLKYKFTYIGFNSRIEYLNNVKIRKALAALVKPEDIIKVVEKGYGEKTVGPINPAKEYFYNNSIVSRTYDASFAQQVFLENGFKLVEGKLINKTSSKPLAFNISFRQNPGHESIAFLLKEEAAKIGLKLNLKQYEGRTISKMARNHDFEIMIGNFSANPNSLDFSAIFSQEAAKIGGINFTGFGSKKSDSLMQVANYAQDSLTKRQALWGLQEELHNEATMLFLYFSKNKIAINKKFDNLKISTYRPGYDVTSFTLREPEEVN